MIQLKQNPRYVGRGWLLLGLGLIAFAVLMGVSHYVFGVPIHKGRSNGLASPMEIITFLAVFTAGGCFFAISGASVLIDLRRQSK